MQKLICFAALFVSQSASALPEYGAYTNDSLKVTIQFETSDKTQGIFYSSACKGEFKLRRDSVGDSSVWFDDKSGTTIIEGEPGQLQVEGSSQCFPMGFYKQVK